MVKCVVLHQHLVISPYKTKKIKNRRTTTYTCTNNPGATKIHPTTLSSKQLQSSPAGRQPLSWSDSVHAWRWDETGPPAAAGQSVCSDSVCPG